MSDVPRSLQSWVSTIRTGRTHSWRFSTSSEKRFFLSRKTSVGIDLLFERREFQIATLKKTCIMYQIRMYLVSAGRNLYVRTLCSRNVCTRYQPEEIYTYVRYVPPVDAHVWRQLHLSAVARCSDSYNSSTVYIKNVYNNDIATCLLIKSCNNIMLSYVV